MQVLQLVPEFQPMVAEYMEVRLRYQAAIRLVRARLEGLDDEFSLRRKRNPIHSMQHRLKTVPSMMEKLRRRGLEVSIASAVENLYDIAGVRVICSYIRDIYTVADALMGQDDIRVIRVRDYIKDPKPNGYRSLHIVVDVPVYMSQGKLYIPVEIQIRTVAMDFWAALEHGIRYKSSDEVPPFIVDELRECADIIARTDDKMQEIFKALQLLHDSEGEN
jgi:putative GTP pyrophosphokinase